MFSRPGRLGQVRSPTALPRFNAHRRSGIDFTVPIFFGNPRDKFFKGSSSTRTQLNEDFAAND